MKRVYFALICCAAICFVFAGTVEARTYAGNLGVGYQNVSVNGTQEIQYHLNDDAASVTIEIKDGSLNTIRTLDGTETDPAQQPGLEQGVNVVEWDMKDDSGTAVPLGTYTFSIATTDVGYATWTNITPYEPTSTAGYVGNPTETVISARFYAPWGVDMIRDKSHPDFGRIYVSNGSLGGTPAGATGAYHDQSGVYFLNCDLSDTGEGWLESATGTMWNPGSSVNPYMLNVDDQREVFAVGGFSDGWEDFFIVDLDGESYVTAFSRTDFVSDPTNHDNMVHSAFAGAGASTTLWAAFEKDNGFASIGTWETGWPITGPITVPHTLQIADDGATNADNGIGSTIYSMRQICISPDESALYITNARWGVSTIACAKMDISGPTQPILAQTTTSWRSGLTGEKQYGTFRSVDFMTDPVDSTDKVLMQKYYGEGDIYICDADDMSLLDNFMPDPPQGSGSVGMTIWDPVGNIIYSTPTYEWLRVYAPPSTPFSFNIDYAGTFQVSELTGLSEDDWEVYR